MLLSVSLFRWAIPTRWSSSLRVDESSYGSSMYFLISPSTLIFLLVTVPCVDDMSGLEVSNNILGRSVLELTLENLRVWCKRFFITSLCFVSNITIKVAPRRSQTILQIIEYTQTNKNMQKVCVCVCVPMPTHCTIACFGFRSRWIDGLECGLFLNHAPLGQTTLRVGRVSVWCTVGSSG